MNNIRCMVTGIILTILLGLMISACGKRQEHEVEEQPHLYWKEIDVEVVSIDKRHWFHQRTGIRLIWMYIAVSMI